VRLSAQKEDQVMLGSRVGSASQFGDHRFQIMYDSVLNAGHRAVGSKVGKGFITDGGKHLGLEKSKKILDSVAGYVTRVGPAVKACNQNGFPEFRDMAPSHKHVI
jgi:hypothetical protein